MSELTSGSLRSVIVLHGVSSLFASFRDRASAVQVPHTQAAAPTTKVRTLALPKKALVAAADAAAIDAAQTVVVVDLGERKKNPSAYGALYTSEPDDGPCWHCRRPVKPEMKVGIPLRIRDDRFHHLLIVDIEGRACNTSCALKFVREHASEHACYEGRETALLQLHEICAPGTKLVAAPNWRLHVSNGGPMTDEEFDKEVRGFVPTPNLRFQLASITFAPA